jgi:hypothetical protein
VAHGGNVPLYAGFDIKGRGIGAIYYVSTHTEYLSEAEFAPKMSRHSEDQSVTHTVVHTSDRYVVKYTRSCILFGVTLIGVLKDI